MEETVVSEMANGGFRSEHDTSSETVNPLSVQYASGCEGQDDEAGQRLGGQLLPVCEPPKDEVNVSPVCEPTEIGLTPGENVNGKMDDLPGFQSPKDEVNGDLNCVSPFTSSVPSAPTAVGVRPGEAVKRRRGRPSKLFKKNGNGALPLGANGTEMPSGETMKRKRGRPPWKKGINGGMPLLSSCSANASTGKDMPSGELPKRKAGRPLKLRDNDDIIIVSSPSSISAPLKTEMLSGEPVKKKRGRPWKREINGAVPMVRCSSTASEPVKKKRGRPSKRRSIGAMQRESSSAMSPAPIAMGLLSSPATPASILSDMPSGEPVKRKPGRPPKKDIGGAVYVKRSSNSSRAVGPRTETMQQSTSHATPERLIGKLPGDGRGQEMAKVGVLETSGRNGMVAQPQTSLLENVSDVDLRQSLPLVAAAAAAETLMQEALPLRFPNANLGSLGVGTTVGAVGSREVCGTVPNASHVTDHSQSRLGVIPIPVEYEHLYKEIEERHGRLDNGQPVGQNDTLPYATLVELLSVVQQLKNLVMESVTEGMIASFERTVTIGRLFKFNVGWLHENLNRLRGDYEKRCVIDVVGLEQDVQRCDTWLEATQDELRQMEATYMAAKKKVDDLIKSRNDSNAKLEAAREHLKSSEKFSFVI